MSLGRTPLRAPPLWLTPFLPISPSGRGRKCSRFRRATWGSGTRGDDAGSTGSRSPAPWLRSGPGRCEALEARARLVGVNPARGPGPRGARSGSDDLSAKLWDVSTGQCVYGIQTHTCAAVKFDEQKLVTGSFDNTVACWEWSSGARTQHFRGHTGAVFSVDYNDELDILVSGSADFTVKVWALSAGTCLNTLTGHTEWVTKVVLQKCKVKSLLHSPGDYILLSADKYEIKPRLHFDGKYIVCSSALGLYQWDFASYDILRVIKTPEIANLALLGFGDVFALLFDNRFLYIMDLRTESLISRWPLPEYRKSKRGSSFLAGEASWLNGLDGHNDTGLVFATSMPDHSIHLVLWKEHG
ncbi:F-box/WD repeat-containing protein 2 [Sciurus carolinensis]|uniref:F-box/WD repeat-containing protein 2 n=1 Tax=Sciurus carolinensis TaxID=30640 RepID=A0AA41MKH8_SCICA|nr:F-box/WD repeat-containing protein 2 [Sciurus carolinensis]